MNFKNQSNKHPSSSFIKACTSALLLTLLPLAGCESGTVETSDIEEFGTVETAIWTSGFEFNMTFMLSSGGSDHPPLHLRARGSSIRRQL